VPSGPHKGEKLEKAKFDKMLDHYYALHDYDENGVPTEKAFKKFGLLEEWKVFKNKIPEARQDQEH
jgi:aldehyde:ferredoxin oxidoreductase